MQLLIPFPTQFIQNIGETAKLSNFEQKKVPLIIYFQGDGNLVMTHNILKVALLQSLQSVQPLPLLSQKSCFLPAFVSSDLSLS